MRWHGWPRSRCGCAGLPGQAGRSVTLRTFSSAAQAAPQGGGAEADAGDLGGGDPFFPPGGRPATAVIVRFIDAFRHVFGVQAICRVLSAHHVPIATRTYWAAKSRPPSRRTLKDALVTRWLAQMFEPGEDGKKTPESLYGAVKAWAHLN